jgi:CubicO group peptidase (beta-lactamase class C family)
MSCTVPETVRRRPARRRTTGARRCGGELRSSHRPRAGGALPPGAAAPRRAAPAIASRPRLALGAAALRTGAPDQAGLAHLSGPVAAPAPAMVPGLRLALLAAALLTGAPGQAGASPLSDPAAAAAPSQGPGGPAGGDIASLCQAVAWHGADTVGAAALAPQLAQTLARGRGASIEVSLICAGAVVAWQAAGAPAGLPRQGASLAKVVTALVTLELAARGLLDLDAPLARHGPSPAGDPVAARITARMVLAHQTGLGNDPTGADRTLYQPPGAGFLYSGAGFHHLQQAVEAGAGVPLDRLARELVFQPLQMAHSELAMHHEGQRLVHAAFSLTSTTADLARLFAALARPAGLRRRVVAAATRPVVPVRGELWWGLGLGIYRDGDLLWHWGNNFGRYHSLAVVARGSGHGLVVMAEGDRMQEPLRQLVNQLLGGAPRGYWLDVRLGPVSGR